MDKDELTERFRVVYRHLAMLIPCPDKATEAHRDSILEDLTKLEIEIKEKQE